MGLTAFAALVAGLLETLLLYLISRLAVVLAAAGETVRIGGIGPMPDRHLSIGTAVVVALVLLVVLVGLSVPMTHSLATLSSRSLVRTRSRLIDADLGSSWAYRSGRREGHFSQMLGDYCQRTEQLVVQLGVVVVAACQVAMLVAGALLIAPVASVVAVVGLGGMALVLRPLTRNIGSGSVNNAAHNRSVASDAQQLERLAAEINTFHVEEAIGKSLHDEVEAAAAHLRTLRYQARLTPILYQYGALGVILVIIGVVSVVAEGQAASLAPIILMLIRALSYIRMLVTAAQSAAEFGPYWEDVQKEIAELQGFGRRPGTLSLTRLDSVEFRNVRFEYVPDRPVLTDVQLTIGRGAALGLVGPSGGGKTTLIQLLLRLREPTGGTIWANNVPLSDVKIEDWAAITAYVPQDNKLIRGTVAENIAFFRSGYSIQKIVEAARLAHLHDEIAALPEGYETEIGPGARSLSGGQCQRLGIARGILGSPQLLVLDEPTSALDVRSELLIRQSLQELRAITTLVLVAHRPATLQICDRIVSVDAGLVAEIASEDQAGGTR